MRHLQAGLLLDTTTCLQCGLSGPLCGCLLLGRRGMGDALRVG